MKMASPAIVAVTVVVVTLCHICSTVSPTRIRCADSERSLLLRLKHEISINTSLSSYTLPPDPTPKFWSWNDHKDCCLWDGVTCDSDSGHVIGLDLSSSSILGGINDSSSIFRLRHLQSLNLAHNKLFDSGSAFPYGFSNLSSLTHLNLSRARFRGPITKSVFSTLGRMLVSLDLSYNTGSSLNIEKLVTNMTRLEVLRLDTLGLSPGFSNKSLSLLPEKLRELSLSNCDLTGEEVQFPSLLRLTLTHLVLSDNYNLAWNVTGYSFVQFPHLVDLQLSDCGLYGTMPSSVFSIPNLQCLDVSSNSLLAGTLPDFSTGGSPLLQVIRLSNTKFSGKLPDTINNLKSLHVLELNACNFNGFIPSSIDNLTELHRLDFYGNNFRGPIPSLHASSNKFELLDFSSNNFSGTIPVSYGHFTNLVMLRLRNNEIQGQIPRFLFTSNGNISSEFQGLGYLDLSSNDIRGDIPSSICDFEFLEVLDLSNNHLNGSIPSCLASLQFLGVLNLKNNKLSGTLPKGFAEGCSLKTLDVNQNNLRGQIPESLSLCSALQVLDVGKNYLTGKFPIWSEGLQYLRVLVLHSNRFSGSIDSETPNNAFPALQIFDVSSNKFVGELPSGWFGSWKGMMKPATDELIGFGFITSLSRFVNAPGYVYLYTYSVRVNVKGIEREYDKILIIVLLLDVSNNNFAGEIPESIAHLEYLQLLNLSNNHFTGHIPTSFGELSQLESLDVSSNALSGNIPSHLTKLTFLSVFNTSHNSLSGVIPHGRQFDTFDANSYLGNAELCGIPLSKPCFLLKSSTSGTNPTIEGGQSVIDWDFFRDGIAGGWVSGVILGILVAKIMFRNPFALPKTRRVRSLVVRPSRRN